MRDKKALFLGGMLVLSCINFLYIVWFYQSYRYLPPPFVFDKENTFMDFYNTLYWSGKEGIYTVWNSVYPPINFLLLQMYSFLFLSDIRGMGDGFEIREAVGKDILPLLALYVLCLLIAVIVSFKQVADNKTKLILFLIFLLSPAFLFAMERGNLIILCIPILSWYIFSSNQISRSIAVSILINLKPYFVIFYILQLINKKIRKENKDFLFLAPIFSLIIFLIAGLILNQEFYLLPLNLLRFAADKSVLNPFDIMSMPSTILGFGYLRGLVTELSIPSSIGFILKIVVYAYLLKIILQIYKFKINHEDLLIFSIIFITNYSISTGGYCLLFYIPVLAILYKRQEYTLLILIFSSMYVGLWDLIPIYKYSSFETNAYLSGQVVNMETYIGLGSIIRPIVNFSILLIFYKAIEGKSANEFV